MSWLALVGLGFLLGLKHALDADHVVAVSTIVSRHRKLSKASLVGALWGLGHTTTLFGVGVAVLAFRLTIPERVALVFELLVGVVLIGLGLSVLWDLRRRRIHAHVHRHDGHEHWHVHSHEGSEGHEHPHDGERLGLRPLLVGMVHGLAGSAALMLLVLSTVDSLWVGALYILVFGIGSIVGMLAVSTVISLPIVLMARWQQGISAIAGLASVALGAMLLMELIPLVLSP
jgi:ABC-type nickel/cobalt efflux system permease component RcnA